MDWLLLFVIHTGRPVDGRTAQEVSTQRVASEDACKDAGEWLATNTRGWNRRPPVVGGPQFGPLTYLYNHARFSCRPGG